MSDTEWYPFEGAPIEQVTVTAKREQNARDGQLALAVGVLLGLLLCLWRR